jgi:WD40 repeat protein
VDLRGRTLGGFLVAEPAADGGWQARAGDGREARVYATVAADAGTASRLLDAARGAARVEHPALARTLDQGVEADHLVWVAGAPPEGTPLDELLLRQGPLPAPRFLQLFDRLCEAVARAHERGVVHGDIRAERIGVSVRDGRLLPQLGGLGAGFRLDARPLDDVVALGALAREALESGATVLGEDVAERSSSPAELSASVRVAAGVPGGAAAPRLDEALRARVLSAAPEPLAEAVAALDAAADGPAVLAAARAAGRVLVRLLGAIALAARSRRGREEKDAAGSAALRALLARRLDDAEWLGLARDLCRPTFATPELHPVPELVVYLRDHAAPSSACSPPGIRPPPSPISAPPSPPPSRSPPTVWPCRTESTPRSGAASVARARSPCPCPRRSPRAGRSFLDPSGQPALSLYPLVQAAEPAPGAPEEIFVLAGPGRHGARLESLPYGAVLDDDRLWSWYGENLLEVSGELVPIVVETEPYRGLEPYRPEDARVFHGREREAQTLVNRLRIEPLVTIVGRAGAGKTSLVQAGVIPSLPADWKAITVRLGTTPLAALAEAAGTDLATVAADADALGRALRAAGEGTRVLIVDPFEELFTLCDDDEERGLASLAVARAARSAADPVRVVLVIRDDYLWSVEALPALRARLARGLHLCATPPAENMLRALVEPARRAGHDVDDRAAAEAAAAEAAALPAGLRHLSAAATWLWQERKDGALPVTRLAEIGGIAGAPRALARQTPVEPPPAEQALAPPPPPPSRRLALAAALLAGVGLGGLLFLAEQRAERRAAETGRELTAARQRGLTEAGLLTDALVERGRRSFLAGDARAAVADLRAAAARRPAGERHAALDLLLAQAGAAAAGERLLLRHPGPGKVWMVGFSPDGQRLVTASDDRAARLWNAATGNLEAVLSGHQGTVWSARFSADGSRIVTAGDDGTVRLWDAAGVALPFEATLTGPVLDAQLTGDLVVARGLDTIVVYRAAGGAPLVVAPGRTMAVALDGATMATGDEAGVTRLIGLPDGRPVTVLPPHAGPVLAVAFSPDGRYLCSASADHTLRIWDVAARKLFHEGREHGGDVTDCVFSPDGSRVATTSADRTAKVWHVGSGDLLFSISHLGEVSRALFSPDGQRLVTASSDGTARLWDAGTGQPRGALVGHEDSVWWLAFDAAGERLATAGLDGTARVWGTDRDALELTLAGHGDALASARFSPDGERVVTASRDRTARIWDARSGAHLVVLDGHRDTVRSAEFSPDGERVLTASKDGVARVYPALGGAPLFQIDAGAPLVSARWNREGTRIVTAEEKGPVRLWTAAGAPAGRIDTGGGARDARFSPDGTRLVVARADRAVFVHDLDGTVALALSGHRLDVHAAAFSPDGTQLVTASADRTARLWSAERGTPRAVLSGHSHEVQSAEFSPSGELVVTAGGDGTCRLWDARTGALLVVFAGHTDWVYGAAFSPDAAHVVTAGGDGTARVWATRIRTQQGGSHAP